MDFTLHVISQPCILQIWLAWRLNYKLFTSTPHSVTSGNVHAHFGFSQTDLELIIFPDLVSGTRTEILFMTSTAPSTHSFQAHRQRSSKQDTNITLIITVPCRSQYRTNSWNTAERYDGQRPQNDVIEEQICTQENITKHFYGIKNWEIALISNDNSNPSQYYIRPESAECL